MQSDRPLAGNLIDRIRSCEPITLVLFAILSGGGLAFMKLASEMLEGETWAFDDNILKFFRQPNDLSVPIGPDWLTHVVRDLTSLGGTTVVSLVTVLTVIYLLLIRKRAAGIFVFVSVVGGWALSTCIKMTIARPRPLIVPHLVDVHDLSFPSGHAMLSAVTYLTLGALLSRMQTTFAARAYIIVVAVLLALIIGCSRIYLGVHYPTDVLGGWCAGATWAALCWMLARARLSPP
ncbi:phosphatase PAP2 family protein [Rhizobium sp. LjRoot98]|uniref:phosphatase PAP2 family protein n=1 Tax=Rhizobium sp. LjRoot98 TaxID=3342345 RepID=UPI003ED036E6